MLNLSRDYIRQEVADSKPIYARGQRIYKHGSMVRRQADPETGVFVYHMDGNYGDYTIQIQLEAHGLQTSCDCPYPGKGCKHTVAALLDTHDIVNNWRQAVIRPDQPQSEDKCLSPTEIRDLALKDRRKRARNEKFTLIEGEMLKGEHLVETRDGKQYTVTLHDPLLGKGHCSCPDYQTNRLGTCKHLLYLCAVIKKKRGYKKRITRERFPFVDIFWDSSRAQPQLFNERPEKEIGELIPLFEKYFDDQGSFKATIPGDLMHLVSESAGKKQIRIQESIIAALDRSLTEHQARELTAQPIPSLDGIRTQLYPYQAEGVAFALHRPATLIGDEMGLGKTLQAITLAVLKKELYGFRKILVITVASLKEQWKREIERFTDESAVVVAGTPKQRESTYFGDDSYFKITNYEAVLRDVTILTRFRPDLIILDEAQRIKNFSTKTAEAVKRLPRQHALVLTGTPLENKLEDVYSIIQFLDPQMLAPLWQFAADYFMLSKNKKGKILGYRNLEQLHTKLKSIVIRRRKAEVLKDLPEEVVNNYYIDLHQEQKEIHAGYAQLLAPLIHKKYLTPMDLRRIMELLLMMRMVCDSTYLIDRQTNISPKLKELEGIIDELILQNGRKVVIFSEWTTMTYLIARHLSDVAIPFVELSGKVPVKKRQALIDEFTNNPDCKVFLSTDAGGTGLNLQAADTVINFELPWNPARMNQRIGRVSRIGQTASCINVVNLIAKGSIEEKILAGIQLKTDLFKGVFDGGVDMVEFSLEKRNELLNELRKMMGEEEAPPISETRPGEEIPEDTPHFLNPEVLKDADKREVDFAAEEAAGSETLPLKEEASPATGADIIASQPPEKIETVLNSGLEFIGGLLEMATGQKIAPTQSEGKMVELNQDTGEVTLKFKLPGF